MGINNCGMNEKCEVENHINLARAIERIDSIDTDLRCLINKIDPETADQAGKVSTNSTAPSLHEVLAYGASRIDNKIETIHKLIQDLRKTLF
jgi:hypothetical protein